MITEIGIITIGCIAITSIIVYGKFMIAELTQKRLCQRCGSIYHTTNNHTWWNCEL